MIDLNKYTPTELLKMSNDIVIEHDIVKQKIVDDLLIVDEIQKRINENLLKLDDYKSLNSIILNELNNR